MKKSILLFLVCSTALSTAMEVPTKKKKLKKNQPKVSYTLKTGIYWSIEKKGDPEREKFYMESRFPGKPNFTLAPHPKTDDDGAVSVIVDSPRANKRFLQILYGKNLDVMQEAVISNSFDLTPCVLKEDPVKVKYLENDDGEVTQCELYQLKGTGKDQPCSWSTKRYILHSPCFTKVPNAKTPNHGLVSVFAFDKREKKEEKKLKLLSFAGSNLQLLSVALLSVRETPGSGYTYDLKTIVEKKKKKVKNSQ